MNTQIGQNKKEFSLVSANQRIESEIKVFSNKYFYYKINKNNSIDYINSQYTETSGIEEYKVIDEPLSSLFHSDMPKLLLSVLQDRLKNGKPMRIIQKFAAKNQQYFWLSSVYSPKLDKKGIITSYSCKSVSVPSNISQKFAELYSILSKIELKTNGIEAARKYLIGFLESKGETYDTFIENICNYSHIGKEQSPETKDYILKRIQEKQRLQMNKQQVSYSKSKKSITIKHDFTMDEKNLKWRA